MTEYEMAYAKTHLDELTHKAFAGEAIVIAADNHARIQLVPIRVDSTMNERTPGDLEGRLTLPDEFFRAF